LGQHAALTAATIDNLVAAAAQPDSHGQRLLDNQSIGHRLGRSIARIEAAFSTPGEMGRVAVAQTMRDLAPDLMDIQGATSVLPVDNDGTADDQGAEHLYRLSGPSGVYGGTLEVYRNMIARHTLGLGRPAYARFPIFNASATGGN
jgi:alkylation response protein AidB-like acyl-CoA dehydrogenase